MVLLIEESNMKKRRSIISRLTALLTSAAVISGVFPAMELMAAAETPAASSAVSLKKDIKSYGDGWFWNGESLLIYGASFDVPENTAYFGEFKELLLMKGLQMKIKKKKIMITLMKNI